MSFVVLRHYRLDRDRTAQSGAEQRGVGGIWVECRSGDSRHAWLFVADQTIRPEICNAYSKAIRADLQEFSNINPVGGLPRNTRRFVSQEHLGNFLNTTEVELQAPTSGEPRLGNIQFGFVTGCTREILNTRIGASLP